MRERIDAEPFTVAVPEAVLDDLRARLARTRWPTEPATPPWAYGAELAWMRAVAAHWLERYDRRAWESRLNAIPGYRATIDGKRVHFLLERGSGENPLPLLQRRFANIVHRHDAPRGGHFLALEQGALFVEELRTFFRRFR